MKTRETRTEPDLRKTSPHPNLSSFVTINLYNFTFLPAARCSEKEGTTASGLCQTNRQLCELLNSHLRIHKWPIQEVYTLMTRHRSVHHTLRTLRIIVRFKVEIISTFQMATQKITETLYYTVTTMHIHNPCTNKILSKV